jgi:uncharacterized protein
MGERQHKILFSGPVGAGKSTAIRSLSDIRPVVTDELASDDTSRRKQLTTVAMDYGVLHLDDGDQVHLYGTPGQERFDFMWDILQEGALGVVILVDNAMPEPLASLGFFVDSYREFIGRTGVAVGVTRTDLAPAPALEHHRQLLLDRGLNPPLFTVDARVRDDVALLVEALLCSIDPEVAA